MHSVLKSRPRSSIEIESAATSLIEQFQPEALKQLMSFDVETFFELHLEEKTGIEPVFDVLERRISGYTDSLNMKCYVSQSLYDHGQNLTTERRLRSTIAHELGHCYLHVPDAIRNREFQQIFKNNQGSIKMYKPEDVKVYENPEWQAWRFAGALLMPEVCFRRAVDCNWTIRQIQNTFEVNPSFVRVRMRELSITKMLKRG